MRGWKTPIFTEQDKNIKTSKIKRLSHACCGMENGKVYDAKIRGGYVSVKLLDGSWTSDHWAGFNDHEPYFEIVEK